MRAYHAATMTQLHSDICDSLIFGTQDELDIVTSVDVQIHDTIGMADSMVWDFNLKQMWVTKSRWSMLARQYIDPEELEAWIIKCKTMLGLTKRGIAVMRTNVVKARGGAATGHKNKESRRWGSCMLAISYKALPKPTITLISRTSYLGYLGALDMSVAWVCAKYLAKEMGVKVEDFSFVWINTAAQWHNFKSLAYMLNHPDPDRAIEARRLLTAEPEDLTREEKRQILSAPGLRLSRKWLRKVVMDDKTGRTYGDMSYNTFRRIIRRFHTEVYGEEYGKQFEGWNYYKVGPKAGEQKEFFGVYKLLPSCPVDSLDFTPIGMPMSRKIGEPFVEPEDEELEDDDLADCPNCCS